MRPRHLVGAFLVFALDIFLFLAPELMSETPEWFKDLALGVLVLAAAVTAYLWVLKPGRNA